MEVRRRLKSLGPVLIPREFVFMDRAAIGLGAAFLHLKAELNFGKMFAESVADFSTEALRRVSVMALTRAGLELTPPIAVSKLWFTARSAIKAPERWRDKRGAHCRH